MPDTDPVPAAAPATPAGPPAGSPGAAAGSPPPAAPPAAPATQPAPAAPAADPWAGIKVPEGVSAPPPATIDAFKKAGYSAEQAQVAIDQYVTARQTETKAWQATVKGWDEARKADQEVGGARLAQSEKDAKALLDKFGTAGFQKLLEQTQIANNPDAFRFLAKVGEFLRKNISEDTLASAPAATSSSSRPMGREAMLRSVYDNPNSWPQSQKRK